MKTLLQQRLYATNSLPSHKAADNPPFEGERESASLLSKSKSDNSTSFAPTPEFTSSNLLDSQKEKTTSKIQSDNDVEQDWSKSFFGLSTKAFPKETVVVLLAPIEIEDIECKPGKSNNLL